MREPLHSHARPVGLGRRWIIGAALGLAIAGVAGSAAAQAPPPAPAPALERAVPVEPPASPAVAVPGVLQPAPGIARGNLPHDLSPWSMFAAADWLVKAVMLSLAFASVVTWTVWLAKSLELMAAGRRLSRDLAAVAEERSLEAARAALPRDRGVLPALLAAAQHELSLSSDVTD
jgi:biopolymer transport protein ExbB